MFPCFLSHGFAYYNVPSNLQRVLMQITQELCKRPGLNKAGFKMPTIFVPTLTGKVSCVYTSFVLFVVLRQRRGMWCW